MDISGIVHHVPIEDVQAPTRINPSMDPNQREVKIYNRLAIQHSTPERNAKELQNLYI